MSVALVVTTMPGTGGITIWSPVATTSLEIRLVFDQRIWLTVTLNLARDRLQGLAGGHRVGERRWLIGADSGMATGLMIVLYRPSETSPTVPPSPS